METPLFARGLKTKVIDGRVYVDLEQLTQLVFEISNESTVVATQHRDPAMGIMALGVMTIGKGLDEALTLHQEAAGVMGKPARCGVSKPHPEHLRLVGRQKVRCEGVADDD